MWGRKGEGNLREENKKLQEETQKLKSENIVLKSRTRGMHPASGVDKALLAKNTELKDENKRLWEAVERALSATNKLEGVALDLKVALYWRIPSRGERKVIVVKKKKKEE